MRQRSNKWIRLATRGDFRMESVAVINGKEYSAITAPVINRGLLPDKTLSVGNCIASTLKLTVMTTDVIPKSSKVVIKARITDETEYSEWLEFGTFWVDQRDTNDELTDLECYDAMLKGNQVYSDNSASMSWPKPMNTVVNRIASQMGVSIDSRTVIKTGEDYVVTMPDEDTTLLDILGHIGAIHGGNWIVTPEGKLRLVPLVSPPTDTFNIIDYDYNIINTQEGYRLIWKNADTGETVIQRAGGGLINVPVIVGDVTTARTLTISRVTMFVDSETGYTSGDDTGYELMIQDNPYATQGLCDALLADVAGIEYAPFTMTGACFDPAAELGDWIIAGDLVRSVLYIEEQHLDLNYRVDASAPGEDELDTEYPYKTATRRTKYTLDMLKKENGKIYSRIEQTQESIAAEVTRASEAEGSLSTRITTTANGLSSEVTRATNAEGSLSSRITQNANSIALKVDAGGVIAAINASAESSGGSKIQISADKVDLSGYATFSSLSTSGKTTINGDNITTGTIKDSGENTTFNLSTGALTMKKGSINLGSGNFVVTTEGKVTCKSASIEGSIKSADGNAQWIEMDTGEIRGGRRSGSTGGSISFLGTFGNDVEGPCIDGASIGLICNRLYVMEQNSLTYGIGQSVTVPIVTDIKDLGNGSIGWRIGNFEFSNGILISYPSNFYY